MPLKVLSKDFYAIGLYTYIVQNNIKSIQEFNLDSIKEKNEIIRGLQTLYLQELIETDIGSFSYIILKEVNNE